jgi:argininosuccinate synthase
MNLNKKISSIQEMIAITGNQKNVLTLFSGGLDSTYLLYLLAENNCKDIFALSVDMGDDVNSTRLEKIASHFGARLIVVDSKEIFAEEAVLPAIAAQARYLGIYPISASLSRPIIAREAIKLATLYNSQTILHTANQSQNSLRRLNGAITQLGFEGYYGTPYEFSVISREEKARVLRKAGVDGFNQQNISGDSNLWCREFESGTLSDPEEFHVPSSLYKWSILSNDRTPQDCSIHFTAGVPDAINGEKFSLVNLINHLNVIGGHYGIGRYAGLEHLERGEKILEVREMPAAYLLLDGYRHLETAIVSANTIKEKMIIEQIWVKEAVEGRWYGDLKKAAEAFINLIATKVTGTVNYKLNDYGAEIISIKADFPLYLRNRDEWEKNIVSMHHASSNSEKTSINFV